MPAKNSIKTYIENGFYHVYNRGVEKRNIFLDEQDYRVFLSYLKIYLTPSVEVIDAINKNTNLDNEDKNTKIHRLNELKNYSEKINLICYVLMPNHFHLELQQIGKKDIGNFMQSLITKYTVYFNKKYKRVGSLFQGRYKAVLIFGKEYLINLSKYIHLNPLGILTQGQTIELYPWSSYPEYIQNIEIKWLKKDYILKYFHESKIPYKDFVENENDSDKQIGLELRKLLLDYDRV